MSVEISKWLLEDIDVSKLESESTVTPLATDDTYVVYGNAYGDHYNYSEYYNYYNYSDYYNYYNYSVYYDYYNYSNYSNTIVVTRHPISQSVLVNGTVTFSVGASNTIDSCQWYIADDATSPGTVLVGATNPTLVLTVSRDLDNKYFYCIVRRGSSSSTSNRALLTVMSLDAFDIYVNINNQTNLFFVRANPPSTTISSVSVADESIAVVTNEGTITGVSLGTTTCLVTGSNGAIARFNITVMNDTPVDRQSAIFYNTAIAIREFKKLNHTLHPSQMANALRGVPESSVYETVEELYTDIASAIREYEGSSDLISPYDFYYRVLSLTI